ncbi:MAG: TerB family tellurite resistance protein [Planctomycetia bacterium]
MEANRPISSSTTVEPCGFDWAGLRFAGEAALAADVRRLAIVQPLLARWSRWTDVFGTAAAVRAAKAEPATPTLYADVHQAAETVAARFGRPVIGSVSVFPAAEQIAAWRDESIGDDGRSLDVVASSALVQSLSADELCFVLGRLAARPLLDQIPFLGDPTAGCEASPEILLVRGLGKLQELTADRFGLAASGDWTTAAGAFVKWQLGAAAAEVDDCIQRLLETDVSEEDAVLGDDSFAFLAVRFKAMKQFAASERFQSLPTAVEPRESAPDFATAEASDADALFADDFDSVDMDDGVEPAAAEPAADTVDRQTFLMHAACWIIGGATELSVDRREAMTALFGDEAVEAVEALLPIDGRRDCRPTCVGLAASMVRRPVSDRREMLASLVRLAVADGRLSMAEQDALAETAALLELPAEELRQETAEHLTPEYADHRFRLGDRVEVLLDGAWAAGAVDHVDGRGDLRVGFDDGDALRLNPTADLIRPAPTKPFRRAA